MEFEMKYKNVNLVWNDKHVMLNMKIERNKTRAMVNEAIINSLTSPLLLHVIFFMMQNVKAPLRNCSAKLWNLAWNMVAKFTYTKLFVENKMI
jgi:hypothetical protein